MPAALMSAKEILGALVAFDTTSSKTNIPCAEWIRGYLAGHGVEAHLLPDPNGIHTNLFATIGPADQGGIALSGHMDVVPTIGQAWDSDPYTVVERNGRLYGRGTSDMKGYLACVLAAAPEFKRRALKTPIHIAFSYDEEVGCTGVIPMVNALGRSLPKPSIVFVGEPTTMQVVDAHKGGARYMTEIIGKDAHSSKPHLGVGSIMIAGQLMAELGRIENDLKTQHVSSRFEPPHATITVSFIEGGIAHNIIPPRCVMHWGVRIMPGLDVARIETRLNDFAERTLLPQMRAVHPDCRITTTLSGLLPAFSSGENSQAVSLAFRIAEQNETFAVPYGTEASHFQAAGCSTVVCGPGDIGEAHQPNEFIAIAELDKCMAFMQRLAHWAEG